MVWLRCRRSGRFGLRTRPPLEVDFCVAWALLTEALAGASCVDQLPSIAEFHAAQFVSRVPLWRVKEMGLAEPEI